MQIRKLSLSKEHITVVADYDCDGVMAAASMHLLLTYLGCDFSVILPRRMSDGYGLSKGIIDRIKKGTIITVDNGIAAIDAVKVAKEKGLRVLVTDHHQPVIRNGNIILPEADLIVDPHVPDELLPGSGSTTDTNYCGAGLVCMIARYLMREPAYIGQIAANAAIATIADSVPLTGGNRQLYKYGLKAIRNGYLTTGMQCLVSLLRSCNIVVEDDIAFRLAPMLNAPGRLYDEGAKLSYDLAVCTDAAEAQTLLEKVQSINETRKAVRDETIQRADAMIEKTYFSGPGASSSAPNPIILFDQETEEGIVGLVASHICECYGATAIVFTKQV